MWKLLLRPLCAAGLFVGASSALAAPITLDAVDAGFINAAGRTSKNDGVILGAVDATFNYSAGAIDEVSPLAGIDVPRKNFFTFDLSGVSDTIIGAELVLFNPDGGYSSPDATETYVLGGSDVPDSVTMSALAMDLASVFSILVPTELTAASVLYGEVAKTLDLAMPDFGAVIVSAADDGKDVTIPFTPPGLDYLNTFKGGDVVLGGLLASLDGADAGDEVIFGFTKPLISGVLSPDPFIVDSTETPKLILTLIPEPSTALLLASGLAAMAVGRRGRRV